MNSYLHHRDRNEYANDIRNLDPVTHFMIFQETVQYLDQILTTFDTLSTLEEFWFTEMGIIFKGK